MRQYFYDLFNHKENSGSIFLDGVLAFLIIISIAIVPINFIPYFSKIDFIIRFIELFIVIVFTIEYLLRIWSAKKFTHYIFSNSGIIDLFAILPFYIGFYELVPVTLEIFILLRFIRIFKLYNIFKNERKKILENIHTKKLHGTFAVDADEKLITIVQKHPSIFFSSLLPVFIITGLSIFILVLFFEYTGGILFSVFFMIIAIFTFIKNWIYFHYDVIYVTDFRLVIQKKHLFGVERSSIPYHTITNINSNTSGIINYLLTTGNITIDTGTTIGMKEKLTFTKVSNIDIVIKKILKAHKYSGIVNTEEKPKEIIIESKEELTEDKQEVKKDTQETGKVKEEEVKEEEVKEEVKETENTKNKNSNKKSDNSFKTNSLEFEKYVSKIERNTIGEVLKIFIK
jgi:hypothetical protein